MILDITSCVSATGSKAWVVTRVVYSTGQVFVAVIVEHTFWPTAACERVSNEPFVTGTFAVPAVHLVLLGF